MCNLRTEINVKHDLLTIYNVFLYLCELAFKLCPNGCTSFMRLDNVLKYMYVLVMLELCHVKVQYILYCITGQCVCACTLVYCTLFSKYYTVLFLFWYFSMYYNMLMYWCFPNTECSHFSDIFVHTLCCFVNILNII